MPEFSVTRASVGEVQIVSVFGDVDLGTVSAIEELVDAAAGDGAGPVVVDLSGVGFMDSIGLRLLIRTRRRLERDDRRLVIVAAQRGVAACSS